MSAATLPDILPDVSSPGQDMSFRTKKTQFGDGYIQVAANGINATLEKWSLIWDSIADTDADTLCDFFENLAGATPFLWTPPKGNTGEVLWLCEGHGRSGMKGLVSTVTAQFTRWYGSSAV